MVDTKMYKSLRDCEVEMRMYEKFGKPFPDDLKDTYNHYKEKESPISTSDSEYFYRTFIQNSKFPLQQEKLDCIRETVDHLLEDGENAKDPVLLLGKIQCGKTDTFEAIICLAFDRGIDVTVVFTKGTRTLTEQTIKRLEKDFDPFSGENEDLDCKIIYIEDILNVYQNLKEARVNNGKTVIVCKKQHRNLEHLIELFNVNCPFLKEKKVLIIDDEADFASINYKKVHNNGVSGDELAKISEQINVFRGIPKYCRYLQVTATPYCLYLQPNGEINLIDGKAKPFRPRHTSLVPVHNKYVGGKQYFEESEDEKSMYSHLFHPIDTRCMSILGKIDKDCLKLGIRNGDIYDLTQAIIAYFVAVAIRTIQREKEGKGYKSSALFHIDINRAKHDSQQDLIKKLIEDIEKVFVEDDYTNRIVWSAMENFILDFSQSSKKARKAGLIDVSFPADQQIINKIKQIFKEKEYSITIVNSDEQMASILSKKTGELELSNKANIFIGGSILDRGITVKNMLCFFYGRNPKKFQQDTVLQHARMYGARSKEDMAVTRFHTTTRIYDIMKRMNENDNQLRQWFIDGKDKNDQNAVFFSFSKDIKPCAPSKIRVSNSVAIKGYSRFLPKGFFTGTNDEIKDIVAKIDCLVKNAPHYKERNEEGFFEMDQQTVFEILKLIKETYVYDKQYDNLEQKDDMSEVISAAIHCGDKSNGKFIVMYKTNRNANRILKDGTWADTPYNGTRELDPAKTVAEDKPVLMLFRETGKKEFEDKERVFEGKEPKNIGWNDAPFYWPVILAQKNLEPVMFAINQRREEEYVEVKREDILEGINHDEVLKLTFSFDLLTVFGDVGSYYDPTDDYEDPYETRSIRDTNAARYLVRNADGKTFKLNPAVHFDRGHDHGLFSYNRGQFPFVLRPYKYLLLTKGRTANCEQMLLKLADQKYWNIFPYRDVAPDGDLMDYVDDTKVAFHAEKTILNKRMEGRVFLDPTVCQWVINYQVEKVIRYLPKATLEYKDDDCDE